MKGLRRYLIVITTLTFALDQRASTGTGAFASVSPEWVYEFHLLPLSPPDHAHLYLNDSHLIKTDLMSTMWICNPMLYLGPIDTLSRSDLFTDMSPHLHTEI